MFPLGLIVAERQAACFAFWMGAFLSMNPFSVIFALFL